MGAVVVRKTRENTVKIVAVINLWGRGHSFYSRPASGSLLQDHFWWGSGDPMGAGDQIWISCMQGKQDLLYYLSSLKLLPVFKAEKT